MDQIIAKTTLPTGLSDKLNSKCFCQTLDRKTLMQNLETETGNTQIWDDLQNTHPHLFASTPAFVSVLDLEKMLATVEAIERVSRMAAYGEAVLTNAPEIVRRDFGPLGVFMGYDFHLTVDGPKLIEINTNAGGAFLNSALLNAQRACCKAANDHFVLPVGGGFETAVGTMFQNEWRLQGRTVPLRTIAIVDDAPQQQYLFPEFMLAKSMLERQGFEVIICDPLELSFSDGKLQMGLRTIDLVYNRLVDFTFEKPEHEVLRRAYLEGGVVVTPNPHLHTLLANKSNLIILSDQDGLRRMGVSGDDIATLATVPGAHLVSPANLEQLWKERRRLFFKPLSGHGGKAVYRGDKITKSTWAEIIKGNYIAQELVTPSERSVKVGGISEARKMDLRLYTYDQNLLIAAARLYQGQTTNFRTPGGGFAPVFII
jgi:hypothetical protein